MDTFTSLFQYELELRVLICKPCAIAIPPAQLTTHLKERHPKVPVKQRGEVIAITHTLPSLAWEPESVCIPKPAREAIQSLQRLSNAYVCTSQGCWYTCTSPRRIRIHCTQVHSWVSAQRRGGDAKKKTKEPSNRMWQDSQPCQRLFKAAGWPAYVAIQAITDEPDQANLSQSILAYRDQQQIRREAAAAQEKIRAGHRVQADPWVGLTEWVPHLQGISRASLIQARQPVEERDDYGKRGAANGDLMLRDVCKAIERLIQKAFKSCRPEIVGRLALEVIERREAGAKSNERPLYTRHKVQTIRKYSQKLVSIFCYLWRTSEQEERPPYKLTSLQAERLQLLYKIAALDVEGRIDTLEQLFLWFWIALLDHPLLGDEHESGLLSGVAVLGLRPDCHGGGWVPAHEFSSTLSALVTTSKVLVVYHAHQEQEANNIGTVYERVRDMAGRFMTLTEPQGAPSPMNRMLRLRALARSLASQRNTPGRVAWENDRLLIDKQSFSLTDLQSMVKGLCETVRVQLLRDVLLLDLDERDCVRPGTTTLPELDLNALVDRPGELGVGWSFLKHPDNKFDSWKDWLLSRVTAEAQLSERFFQRGSSASQLGLPMWRDDAVAAYMKGVRRFKEGLFTLVHLSAGAPARGTEITSIQCENSMEGYGSRGVYVEGGMVSFTTTYHKGYSLSKHVKTIHRYLPREVGELVVYYLGLGRPFVDDVQMMHGGVARPTAFLWEPPAEEEWVDSDSEGSVDADGDTDEDTGDQQTPANPDGYWDTDRVRRVLREQTFQYMGAAIGTSAWRHAYPAIHRELAKDGKARAWLEVLYYGQEPVAQDAQARQSGHTLRIEEGNYGRSMLESPFQTMAERQEFRRVSMDWHRVLEFASAWEDGCMHPGVRAEIIAQQEKQALQRWSSLAMVNLKAEFRRLAGRPDAEYRGNQEEALKAVMERQMRVLVVMATGAGKSMLFMLPASVSPGSVTVVVAPLNALRDNLQDRCDQLGIPCARWDGRRPPYWAQIVLVTPESAITKAFGRFLDEKRMLRQLDRIVIDECHVMLESTARWRPDVLKMTEMTKKGTQVVYLTATLPPILQPSFLQLAGLDVQTVTICRDKQTTRANIAYKVLEYPRDALDAVLEELVAAKRGQYGLEAQIIVYCPSVKETKRLARILQCSAYYREMATDDEKARMVRSFTMGIEKLCTATNMLGLGLDAAGVRVVIHVAMCNLLLQYVQESGRAGRTGLESESIVLRACHQTKEGGTGKALRRGLDLPMREFLEAETCRRVAIDEYMDGRQDRQRCEVGEAKCDLCEQDPHGTKRVLGEGEELVEASMANDLEEERQKLEQAMAIERRRVEIQQRRRTEQVVYELERLDQHLQRWSGTCAICTLTYADPTRHHWKECPQASEKSIQAMAAQSRCMHRVKWEKFARCIYCWAPQAVCNKWEETSTQGVFRTRGMHVQCQYDGVLKDAVAALLTFQHLVCRPWLEQQMQSAALVHGSFDDRLHMWLGRKVKMGQRDASEMCRFLYAWEEGQVHLCGRGRGGG